MLLGIPLGAAEIAVIVLIILLIFGPSKLPQLGKSVGQMLRGFKAMLDVLRRQRAAVVAELPVSAAVRKDRLKRCLDLLVSNKDRFVDALSQDYGHRSPMQ